MKKEIKIERIFEASVEEVWKMWTEPEMIKKWWGPEGFSAPSIKIDLKEGGKYVYGMKGPEDSEWDKVMYSGGIFEKVVPMKKIVATDYFCDEDGNKMDPVDFGMGEDMPKEMPTMTIEFEELEDNKTKLTITYAEPESEAQYEAMLKSGMQEGWQSSFNKFAANL